MGLWTEQRTDSEYASDDQIMVDNRCGWGGGVTTVLQRSLGNCFDF